MMGIMSKKYIPFVMIAASLFLNIAAWCFPSWTECYVDYIFPLWVETYGRITGFFSFSVGEWMLYVGVGLFAVWVIWGSVLLLISLYRKIRPHKNTLCKHVKFRQFSSFLLWIMGIVCLWMTLSCFLLYHVPSVAERFLMVDRKEEDYGWEALAAVRDMVVERANELSTKMDRDEMGLVVTELDLEEQARQEMTRLGEQFQNLKGYYPRPKKFFLSELFSQQYIMGYYFPFSMEANYNDLMYIVNKPSTMCHELSHLKGFIKEDEANFIGYLACVYSEEELFQYSAYLSVLDYLDRDFLEAVGEAEYWKHPAISEQVKKDNVFLTQEAWEQVESHSVLDTQTVQRSSYQFLETTLQMNGVEDGLQSYSRVVELLLMYYDGKVQ